MPVRFLLVYITAEKVNLAVQVGKFGNAIRTLRRNISVHDAIGDIIRDAYDKYIPELQVAIDPSRSDYSEIFTEVYLSSVA